MVRYQGEKMSKSLGNLIWARDLLQSHTADAVRILVTAIPITRRGSMTRTNWGLRTNWPRVCSAPCG